MNADTGFVRIKSREADGIGQGSHRCPVKSLFHQMLMQSVSRKAKEHGFVEDLDELLTIHGEAAFDAGFDLGMDHMAGKSEASRAERADALERRRHYNGRGTAGQPLDDRTFEDGVLNEQRAAA